MLLRAFLCLFFLNSPVRACELALMLAVDISGSVDPSEYRIQRDGLAAALRDPVVSEALVRAQAQVSVMQWTGTSRQKVTIPWVQIRSFADVDELATRVGADPRRWRSFSTAIGEALKLAESELDRVAHCRRRVIDVSGDGVSNEGVSPRTRHESLRNKSITVNALVIDTEADTDLTAWFWENVITGEGAFVVTANGFQDYPQRIRQKLLREIATAIADSDNKSPQGSRFVITANK